MQHITLWRTLLVGPKGDRLASQHNKPGIAVFESEGHVRLVAVDMSTSPLLACRFQIIVLRPRESLQKTCADNANSIVLSPTSAPQSLET